MSSLASPTGTLWTAYPSNKSDHAPAPLTSQTAISTMKDMSLSLVPSFSTRSTTGMRRMKRTLAPTVCESSKKVKAVNGGAKLLIDGPFWGKGKWPMREIASVSDASSSTQGSPKSLPHAQPTLPDPESIRVAITNYLAPAPYSTLSEDIATLMRALDDLLDSINAQTTSFANDFVYRTREEAAYRHSRAKSNAKKIRNQGRKFLKGFKKTVAEQAQAGKMNAKEVKLLMKDVAEGVKEGISQSLKIKKRGAGKQAGEKSGAGCNREFQYQSRKCKRQHRAERVAKKFCSEFGQTFTLFGRREC